MLPGQTIKPASLDGQAGKASPGAAQRTQAGSAGSHSFRLLLDESLRTNGGIKFSAHALRRLASRSISLLESDVKTLEAAVDRAAAKGSRDSLVLADRFAMVVNVPSRTVITAFDRQGLRENVVTNIDSAVFME
ncbi:hypothetical protein IIA79_02705 [bacterium]|nr:hypothetical protein [bacterium]